MKNIRSALTLVLLVAVQLFCVVPGFETPTPAPPVTEPAEESVGTINLVFAQVQVGRPDELEYLDSIGDFYNGYGVRVTGGGKGKLDLNDGTRLTLFNETEVSGVTVSVSPKRSDFFLKQEGFIGTVPSGGRTTVDLPNGARITILGTTFFILYNETTEVATAGNFDGTVTYTLPNGVQRELRPGNLVDIPAEGETRLQEITFTPQEFEAAVDAEGIPTAGLAILLKQAQGPLIPVTAPQLLTPADYMTLECPARAKTKVILAWQAAPDPTAISGYDVALEVSADNEFWTSYETYPVEGGGAKSFDISTTLDSNYPCTDNALGLGYYRWRLAARDTAGNQGPWSDWAYFGVSNPQPGLTAATQLSPAHGTVFSHFPRTTTLEWSSVPGAVAYFVEVDCYHCCQSNQWCTDVGGTYRLERVAETSYTFDFAGAQPGRWRVWAVLATGEEGPKSDWWEFSYTQ